MSDYCLFAEALLVIVRTMRAGLVCRRRVPQCTVSVAKAKRCAVVFAVCKGLIEIVTVERLICFVVCARFFATHERQVLLL